MNAPPFCINLATEKARSSTGRFGTGPPNSVYLHQRQTEESQKENIMTGKTCKSLNFKKEYKNLPACPCFCPHLGLISLVGRKIVTVEAVASVDLLQTMRCKHYPNRHDTN